MVTTTGQDPGVSDMASEYIEVLIVGHKKRLVRASGPLFRERQEVTVQPEVSHSEPNFHSCDKSQGLRTEEGTAV